LAIAGAPLYGEASHRYERELRRLISSFSLEQDVVLLGAVDDISLVYASADVVVQPAIHPEGFGRVVVEAQLAGVPVVATRIGGAKELIDDGKSGLLIPAGDAAALRSAAARILHDHELATTLVMQGRCKGSFYSAERHVDAMEAVYERVLSR